MGISNILDKPIFSSRFKFHIHIAQVVLVILAIALTLPRLFITNVPRTRASTYALGMVCGRSLPGIILAVDLLTNSYA
jgi:hypothetical protein